MAPTIDVSQKDFERAKALLTVGQINYRLPAVKQIAEIDTSKYIVVPQDYSGLSHSYAVSPGRLTECSAITKVVKELELNNYQNTSKDSLGRDFVGNNNWFEFMKLDAGLGLINPDMQESFYFFKLLRDGAENKRKVFDVSGKVVDPSFLRKLHDDFFKVQSPWRANSIGTEFKKDEENILAYSHHTLENGVLVPQRKIILNKDALMKNRFPGMDLNDWQDGGYTLQGFPAKSVEDGSLYDYSPSDGNNSVARLVVGSDWANLYCYGSPSFRNLNLGVLAAKQLE